ncbi:hypothetical protein A3D77_05120 [Candidatus Gottesmanbacteria bacterium RIFCSPHIGHO2_02_FULL_39_11]|uniref:PIN domain-containing protein n=1 Tax=Candidatus Gottesmanbacteria bacterium RIFCSPHIGHO2_02_FULL_39_11 TaxID=1798382 RepID=A0A1F5ZM86_9BACT|nr:MAG: hypothetical protein A3D77_05120 [Candidatus Gottesmanbacteria bacterium RIFCSPHIGHO2_02_FULL_39_11]
MIVLDASVVVKWIQAEEDSEKARILRDRHLTAEEEIIIPQLLFYELANTLTTRFSLKDKEIEKGLKFLFESELQIHRETEEDILQASILANHYHTAVYDMMYVVVAKKNNTVLVTSDIRFIEKTNFPFVISLAKYSKS